MVLIQTGVTGAVSNQPTPLPRISNKQTQAINPKLQMALGPGLIQTQITTAGVLIIHQDSRNLQRHGKMPTSGLRAINKIGTQAIKDQQDGHKIRIITVMAVIYLHKTIGKRTQIGIVTKISKTNGETGMDM